MKRIEGELAESLRELREEIEKLEDAKAGLLGEIENLKAQGKERVDQLREEVETLREEVAAFRSLIDTTES